nr:MAG TPA: hypothetical protein [Bacteriophage sp.]
MQIRKELSNWQNKTQTIASTNSRCYFYTQKQNSSRNNAENIL